MQVSHANCTLPPHHLGAASFIGYVQGRPRTLFAILGALRTAFEPKNFASVLFSFIFILSRSTVTPGPQNSMRLLHIIDVQTFEFKSYEEDAAPKYAILSHTWGDDEVTYKDMRKYREQAKLKAGYEEIKRCAELAIGENLKYFWIDTCCIDKSSSAELSEAINSMFRWYQNAAICFVYLADVQPTLLWGNPYQDASLYLARDVCAVGFKDSRWFTRGWTLQELVAPKFLVFYSRGWVRIGTKQDLRPEITARTLIPYEVLATVGFDHTSMAQRMSWASSRTTSRKEDMAYCLLGLFEVNMPLLYGEGKRAFMRLQEEIIKRSEDMSTFAWTDPEAHFSSYQGLFAQSPSNFTNCHQMGWRRPRRSHPFELTNKGLKLNVELAPIQLPNRASGEVIREFIMSLPGVSLPRQSPVGVRLQWLAEDEYARVEANSLPSNSQKMYLRPPQTEFCPQTIFVRQTPTVRDINTSRVAGIQVNMGDQHPLDLYTVSPEGHWAACDHVLSFEEAPVYKCPPKVSFAFRDSDSTSNLFALRGFDSTFNIEMDLNQEWRSILGVSPPDTRVNSPYKAQIEVHVAEGIFLFSAHRDLIDGDAWVFLAAHTPRGVQEGFQGSRI